MHWHVHDSPAGFIEATRSLVEHAALNQLPLGIAADALLHPSRFEDVRMFTVSGGDGGCLGALVHTPPRPVLLSEMAPDTAVFAARQLVARYPDLAGVNGPSDAAHALAGCAVALTGGRGPTVVSRMAVWVLHEVAPVPIPAGFARVATPVDAPRIQAWVTAFRDEAVPADPPPTPLAGNRYGSSGRAWLWEVDGQAVAFANFPREVGGYWSVGPVYTPPDQRGRGYATALVAHMSSHALAQGHRGCTLFTDLSNPTSNAIYARIGYRREANFTRLQWAG